VTFPYAQWLAEGGVSGACTKHPELKSGINVQGGRITNEAVAAAHGLPFSTAKI
jgi:alanine dehydrogenase